MAEAFNEGLKLGKFPSFTSISVVDNFFAVLWAGIIQDIEAVVSDFILLQEWDYKAFLEVAESRGIVLLHRCAFNIFSHDKSVVLQTDKSRRGKIRDQLLMYRRIMNTIFNATKDIWLEPLLPLKGRNPLADLKRRVAGLYLLYYLWHNQKPADKYKVLIRYSRDDQIRANAVGQVFLKFEKKIPNATTIRNCYKYLVTALSKRNALSCTYIVDEPKIEFQHWQQMYLKNTGMRKCVTAVNANNHFYQLLPELEKICVKMIDILKEVGEIAKVPVEKSFFFRNMLHYDVIKSIVQLDEKSFQPLAITLPFSYVRIAEVIASLVNKNLLSIERPFLTLDTLLQTDRAPNKIRENGIRMARELRQKYIYNKTNYEKNKAAFNLHCEKQRVPKYKISKTKKYREMKSPGWLFINKEFFKIFNQESNSTESQTSAKNSTISITSPLVSLGDITPSNNATVSSKEKRIRLTKEGSFTESTNANNRKILSNTIQVNNSVKWNTSPSEKFSISPSPPHGRRVSARNKNASDKLQEISCHELVSVTADTETLNRLGVSVKTTVRSPGSRLPLPPHHNVSVASKSVVNPDVTSYDLDEDEKMLQAAILKSGKVRVDESTESLKEIYGLRQSSKRKREAIDPSSTDDGDLLNVSSSSETSDVPIVDLESSDDFSD